VTGDGQEGDERLTRRGLIGAGAAAAGAGFVGGDKSREFNGMAPADRKAAVVAQFTQFFGSAAANPIDYLESNWAGERWSRGCPVGVAGPGVYTGYAAEVLAEI
jgi:monoamine oxidase